MRLRLRRWMVLTLAWLPLAAMAQSAVGDAQGDADLDIKAGNLAYMATFNALYRLDLSNGAAAMVGTGYGFAGGVQIGDMDGLAFAPDGTLYGVADSPRPALFRISTASGRATLVEQFREGGVLIDNGDNLNAAIGFTCSGKLLMASRSRNRLWEVNPATADVRPIGALAAQVGGIAALADANYALGIGSQAGLLRISETDAAATRVPGALADRPIPAGGALAARADGSLFTVVDPQPAARQYLLEFTPDGGITREVAISGTGFGGTNAAAIRGLAIGAPVCQPAVLGPGPVAVPTVGPFAIALLAALMALAGFVLRRRAAA